MVKKQGKCKKKSVRSLVRKALACKCKSISESLKHRIFASCLDLLAKAPPAMFANVSHLRLFAAAVLSIAIGLEAVQGQQITAAEFACRKKLGIDISSYSANKKENFAIYKAILANAVRGS